MAPLLLILWIFSNFLYFLNFVSLITVEKEPQFSEYFQISEKINHIYKLRNMIHFLQKKGTLAKWLMLKTFVCLEHPHQQVSDTTKEKSSPFRTASQLLELNHSLCSPSSLSLVFEVFQKKFWIG